jgi:hypothetical protein
MTRKGRRRKRRRRTTMATEKVGPRVTKRIQRPRFQHDDPPRDDGYPG